MKKVLGMLVAATAVVAFAAAANATSNNYNSSKSNTAGVALLASDPNGTECIKEGGQVVTDSKTGQKLCVFKSVQAPAAVPKGN